nr:hypothetical protein [Candidatus Freyarchaeota archaeon]
MRVWITTIGESRFAVINPVWAACVYGKESFIPERVHLFKNRRVEHNVAPVKEWITRILKPYGIDAGKEDFFQVHDADEDDIDGFAVAFRGVVEAEAGVGNEVAIDITPGRKFMSAYAMLVGKECKVRKIYYLHLYNISDYRDKAFILIPLDQQNLINLLEYKGGSR